MAMFGMSSDSKKKVKPKTTFESATTPATFAGTNKPINPNQLISPDSQTTGVYNKEKGGYATPNGLYPTTNPDFVPDPNSTQVKFNKDNSVNFSPNGSNEVIKLSREEYNTSQNGVGNVTNKVKQIEAAQQPQIEQIPMPSQQIEQQALQTDSFDLRERSPVVAKTASIVINGFNTLAGLVPGIGRYLRVEGKSDEVKKAEQTFNDMNTVLGNDVVAVKAGVKSKSDTLKDLNIAREATLRLYAQTKGQGQLNLGFWVDKGAAIEAELARQKSVLDGHINDLNRIP